MPGLVSALEVVVPRAKLSNLIVLVIFSRGPTFR